jgi:hypothetical protein
MEMVSKDLWESAHIKRHMGVMAMYKCCLMWYYSKGTNMCYEVSKKWKRLFRVTSEIFYIYCV